MMAIKKSALSDLELVTTNSTLDGEMTMTTGAAAKVLGVAPRTCAKWMDSGRLKGYRLAGSNDRRVTLSEVVAFCKREGMPVPKTIARFDPTAARCLIAWAVPPESLPEQVIIAADAFELGQLLTRPVVDSVILGDLEGMALVKRAATRTREIHPHARILIVVHEWSAGELEALDPKLYDRTFSLPGEPLAIARTIFHMEPGQ